jgi:hypothetical protein
MTLLAEVIESHGGAELWRESPGAWRRARAAPPE